MGHYEKRKEERVKFYNLNNIFKRKTYIRVVATDHLAVRHLVAQTVGGLVRVDRHVQDVAGVGRAVALLGAVIQFGVFLETLEEKQPIFR